MNPQQTSVAQKAPMKPPCPSFAISGRCDQGQACKLDHDDNLNLILARREIGLEDYEVPNKLGEACTRCIKYFRACDKPDRENTNDPCSECRHFAAGDGDCALATNLTYNDQAWIQMMMRGEDGYNLAPPKDRLAPVRTKKLKTGKLPGMYYPGPMPDDKIKPGWQGKSKEELLVTADFLPVHVREYPRAYLVPPRVNEEKKRKKEIFSQQNRLPVARSVPYTATPAAGSTLTNISQPLGLIHTMRSPIPPQVPNRDAVIEFRFNYKENQASYQDKDGSEFRPPAGPR